jgi:hypothetical protein
MLDRVPGELPQCVELPMAYIANSLPIAIITAGDHELATGRAWGERVLGPVLERGVQRYRAGDPDELACLVAMVPPDLLFGYREVAFIALRELHRGYGRFADRVHERPHRHSKQTLEWLDGISVMTSKGDPSPGTGVFVYGATAGATMRSRSEAIARLASAEDGKSIQEHREAAAKGKEAPAFAKIRKSLSRTAEAVVDVDLLRVLCPVHTGPERVIPVDRPTLDWSVAQVVDLAGVTRGQVISFHMRLMLPVLADIGWGEPHGVTFHGAGLALHFCKQGDTDGTEHLVTYVQEQPATVLTGGMGSGLPAVESARCSVQGCRVSVVPSRLLGLAEVFPPVPVSEQPLKRGTAQATHFYPCECGQRIPGPWTLKVKYTCEGCGAVYAAHRDDDGATTTLLLEATATTSS